MISPFGPTGSSCLIPFPNLLPIPAAMITSANRDSQRLLLCFFLHAAQLCGLIGCNQTVDDFIQIAVHDGVQFV